MASLGSQATFVLKLGTEAVNIYAGASRKHFLLHKKLLVTQSEYFNKALNGPFREAEENTIYLKEDDPDAIGILVSWLYAGSIPTTTDYLDVFDNGEDTTVDSCKTRGRIIDPLSQQIDSMRGTGFQFQLISEDREGVYAAPTSNHLHHISAQPKFRNYSPEELRMMDLINIQGGGSAVTQLSLFPPVVVTSETIPVPWLPPPAPAASYWNLPFGNNFPLFYNPGTIRPITAGIPYNGLSQALFDTQQRLAFYMFNRDSKNATSSILASNAGTTRSLGSVNSAQSTQNSSWQPGNASQAARDTNTATWQHLRKPRTKKKYPFPRIKQPTTHGPIIPGIPPSNLQVHIDEAAHNLALLKLCIFAEKILWSALFNVAITAYVSQTQRLALEIKHVELIYTLTYSESPLRRYALDMIHKFHIAGTGATVPKALCRTSTSTLLEPTPGFGLGSEFNEDLNMDEDEKAYQALAQTNEDFCHDYNSLQRTEDTELFSPTIWYDPDSSVCPWNRRQSIYFQEGYQTYSPEELRILDYEQSRRYGPSAQRVDSTVSTPSTTSSLLVGIPTLSRTNSIFGTEPCTEQAENTHTRENKKCRYHMHEEGEQCEEPTSKSVGVFGR
ncbi:hypothetical protein BP6252_02512 [Coleophoma cylindrospora]|uniref:BTB domain-containing protein n=1 Tax=Coleophoma cylindrospora TaxID=1849047 RepID=A0A3D8SF27_9HELO|nr:hypothetical protein BP6252_02512 [Coleophoma cylindrospora]